MKHYLKLPVEVIEFVVDLAKCYNAATVFLLKYCYNHSKFGLEMEVVNLFNDNSS